jgi:hypothetical protein
MMIQQPQQEATTSNDLKPRRRRVVPSRVLLVLGFVLVVSATTTLKSTTESKLLLESWFEPENHHPVPEGPLLLSDSLRSKGNDDDLEEDDDKINVFMLNNVYKKRLVFLEDTVEHGSFVPLYGRSIRQVDIAEQTDRTQVYDRLDSEDLPEMERRVFPQHPYDDDCEPAADWQRTFHSICNDFHALDMIESMTASQNHRLKILSEKGFWRTAWVYKEDGFLGGSNPNRTEVESIVLKTHK